ncbi:MAG: ATP-dependent Clp protease ATP-binding subunit [Kiritimatiellae bacterium]|nr:ATP-dependent Clp protease ATP-binding subunit [Kiritimatiellia bacterium]MBR4476901.1 ATP-dependent Clp protease ATP-binding subunit [Kiritimatiellia bacterium]
MNAAASCAAQLGHDHIGSEHLLLSILAIPKCEASLRLVKLGLSLDELSESMKSMIAGDSSGVIQRGPIPVTARTKKVVEMAGIDAGPGNVVGTVNLVSGMLREGENAAAQLLFNVGVTLEKFHAAGTQGENQDGTDQQTDAEPEDGESGDDEGAEVKRGENGKAQKTPTLNSFGRDLTDLARQGGLDPVVGREKELRRVIQILSRRTKNNAVLIGEAGVGKTAVAEGLAQAIHRGEVPEKMQSKRVVALDMARVVAGTQYRGQFEERLKRIIDETKRSGNIILFLDEIHTMVGAGGAEGAMDAANILKPALARGELQCIGATTLKEYHKSIEKDAALERRFQSVQVDEPSVADTISILKGIAPKYEEHHSVRFSQEAIRAAVELTARYLPARQLPDKAIDAIDETGARLRMRASERPKNLTSRQADIDSLRGKKDAAVAHGDFDAAARYRDAIKTASREFDAALAEWKSSHAEETISVTADDVAETVSSMSGVPVEKMNATTAEKLIGIENSLGEVVIGQEPAIKAIARALRRSRAFLADPKRPIGSFLFLGPTGVGKTHLAKMLAERVYGDAKSLITLDMSEFQEKYSSSRLVGAPPGYVGYDEGGQLTEKVRRRPYSVVLFDEFEKANGDVMNMLLQILDDGRLTDGQGRIIDFRNTIIICTANLGFDFAREGHTLGFATDTAETSYDMLKDKLLGEAKRTFRPELLNRFDETVVFRKLEKGDMVSILKLELGKLQSRLKDAHVTLTLDKKATEFLVEKGYDSALGARPLRRVVQEYLEDPLADLLLAGKTRPRMRAKLAKDGKSLKF